MPTREIHGVSADTGAAHADAAHPAIARVKALIAQGITASGYARAAAVAGGPFKPSFGLSGAVDQARPRGQRIGRSGDSILPFWRTAPGGVEPGAPCLAHCWPDVGVSEPPIREVFVLSWSLHLRPRGRVPTLSG